MHALYLHFVEVEDADLPADVLQLVLVHRPRRGPVGVVAAGHPADQVNRHVLGTEVAFQFRGHPAGDAHIRVIDPDAVDRTPAEPDRRGGVGGFV